MSKIHILFTTADKHEYIWCPYCDEVLPFGHQYYYEDWWCTKCHRMFPNQHQFPKGFNIKTGDLAKDEK